MAAFYNEFDPFAAEWLENLIKEGLIPDGIVDRRNITELTLSDLAGFDQVHLFAGIGGWPLALRHAGWPDDRPVWTGSCPCQPFSSAANRKGAEDERDLWPEMFRLIKAGQPQVVFGEQVASSDVVGTKLEDSFIVAVQAGDFARANTIAKRLIAASSFHYHPRWITRIRADLGSQDYTLRHAVLGAHSAGAPHLRQRLFWVADSCKSERRWWSESRWEHGRTLHIADSRGTDSVAFSNEWGHDWGKNSSIAGESQRSVQAEAMRSDGTVADPAGNSGPEHVGEPREGIRRKTGSDDSAVSRGIDGGVGDSNGHGRTPRESSATSNGHGRSVDSDGCAGPLEHSPRDGRDERGPESGGRSIAGGCGASGLGDDERSGLEIGIPAGELAAQSATVEPASPWSDYRIIPCSDGKARRIGRSVFPLVNGIPRGLGSGQPEFSKLVRSARSNRVGRLKGYGNAIVPAVAAEFVRAFLEG